ncbi:MAG TPA: potassium uptake system protein [Lachnospiraceae bacterium]|nr:potassium uptake system protein [Lachnospiraceae bacterium]
MNKQYAVLGLGRFGSSVALTLADAGCEVLAVDSDEEKVQELADHVTYAVTADVTEPGVLESLSVSNIDIAVIGIAGNMEDSILATILAKEAGAGYVIAKAMSEIHGTILEKVGADKVIYPERDSGIRLAKNLVSGNFMEFFALSDTYSIAELKVPRAWSGKSLKELDLRKNLGLNVIGVMMEKKTVVNVDPDTPLEETWTAIVVGDNRDLQRIPQ